MPWDTYNMLFATSTGLEQADRTTKRIASFICDYDQKNRMKKHECKCCYYLRSGGITLQAFTEWKCAICGTEYTWGNSGVPKICIDCATDHKVCVSCGGDIDMNDRRRKL